MYDYADIIFRKMYEYADIILRTVYDYADIIPWSHFRKTKT